jgi:quinolinate synthase
MAHGNPELTQRINILRKNKNAVILAHNYQLAEVQDIADFTGDSLELSQNAAKTDADIIVFCGVHFMAETASILCPDKIVLLPDEAAGCPMANMITADELRKKKQELSGVKVVCYINSSAEVKAESDICCTSANAVRIVDRLDAEEILFVPDQYLGHYVSTRTNKKIYFWPGYCPTHARIQAEDILSLKKVHPAAKAIVHPECRPDVIAVADEVMSTGGMLRYARNSEIMEIIVVTEIGIIHRLEKENPEKNFIAVSQKAVCPDMKRITPEKILRSLEEMSPRVKVPEDIRIKAKVSVDRMLETGSD